MNIELIELQLDYSVNNGIKSIQLEAQYKIEIKLVEEEEKRKEVTADISN